MRSLDRYRDAAHAFSSLVALLLLASHPVNVFAYITLHEGPAYDPSTNTGYTAPSFRFIAGTEGNAEPGRLLNNDGTATWNALNSSVNQNRALRWNPASGPALELELPGIVINPESIPFAISANDTVVGRVSTTTGPRAAKWNGSGAGLTILAGGTFLTPLAANDINDSDVIVGQADLFDSDESFGTAAVRWVSGNIELLARPTALVDSDTGAGSIEAVGVNEAGEAIGSGTAWAGGINIGQRAVRWDASGAGIVLGHLGTSPTGTTQAEALSINDNGAAIGYAYKYDAESNFDGYRAVRWNADSATAIELEVLGTDPDGFGDSYVYDINNAGQAVGHSLKYIGGVNFGRHAVVWNDDGQATELLSLQPGALATAYDINESGIAVGAALDSLFQLRAVYWTENGVPVDLNTLIEPHSDWTLTTAWAISDTGWILGEGSYIVDPDGPGGQPGTQYSRVFMLQLPESPALPGDYNDDGEVDAADHVLWRKHLGTNTTLPNDPSFGKVDALDFTTWQANFGRFSGAASANDSPPVPEPAGIVLVALGWSFAASWRLRRAAPFA